MNSGILTGVKIVGEPARKSDHRYTYGEYRTWPDDERWELIDGVAWNMSPAPAPRHQRVLIEIARRMADYLEGKKCRVYPAPFDVLLADDPREDEDEVATVVQPDISVVCDPSKITERACVGAPDLAVEILSPSTTWKDVEIKRKLYERHGVREYWLVDPGNHVIHLYMLQDNGRYSEEPALYLLDGRPGQALLSSRVLDGFVLDLAGVFVE